MNIEKQIKILNDTNEKLTKRVEKLVKELNKAKKDVSKETNDLILELTGICKEWKTAVKMLNRINEKNERELAKLHRNLQDLKIAKKKLNHTLSVAGMPLSNRVKNKILAFINR